MTYIKELTKCMDKLAEDGYLFIGQSVQYSGTGLFHTIKHLPASQRIELPVFEDIQMGMSIGMALQGLKVVSIYPRIDFLILALNQLVLHLDKIDSMSDGQFKPKVIVRTAIGSVKPLFPGEQHNGDYTDAIKMMLKNVDVFKLSTSQDVVFAYNHAMLSKRSSLLIEIPDNYEND